MYGETLLSRRLPKNEMYNLYINVLDMHESAIETLLKEYVPAIADNQIHLLKGEPSTAIAELAEKLRVELIVMGTVARTGIKGFFIGNTAEKILRKVDCSVLALKPDGFITPINLDELMVC